MIASFGCRETEKLFRDKASRRFQAIERPARRRLLFLHAADSLAVLAAIPGNRLERLKGDRRGQFSLRVNAQWRLCFRWHNDAAYDVEIVDYH